MRNLVREGDTCLDLGCGIGYFTIPMARLVGPAGSVTAVDLQPRMLAGTRRRAERAGVSSRIVLLEADVGTARLGGPFDFALAFWMLHEVGDQVAFLRAVSGVLKTDGRLAIVEPRGHVRQASFDRSVQVALANGFRMVADLHVALSRGALLSPTAVLAPPVLA